jgi:hypothetical protein
VNNQHAKSRSMCRLYHSTRGGHSQQPTNTMSTESTQYQQDWEPVFTDNHIEHAATTCKFAVLGTVLIKLK